MIQFGMPTLLELEGLEANAKMCKSLGLQFVEINMNMPEFQVEELKSEFLQEMMKKYDIYFTFHMADNLDIANFQAEVRLVNLDILIRTLELAMAIGSPVVNMHMQKGVYFTLPTERVFIYDKYRTRYESYIKEARDAVGATLGRSGTMLTIENTGDFHLPFIREATKKMIEIGQIQLTYDIGHDYSSFGNDKEFIIEHLDRIKHMHIHDAIGVDHHLALGSGDMPLHKYIGFASNYHLRCVIEAKTIEALAKSVETLPKYLF